ncbi:MAG: ATP-binding protein [Nitrospiraceae bacterium]
MGETRVDLLHLLEDLRDAYPGALEETILTEMVANSLDSGASRVCLATDAVEATLTAVDNGSGMQRRDLIRYHDLATTTKTRGEGIGFAGVGIKLGLLASEEVVTETRRGKTHIATRWSLTSRHRAPWKWMPPPGLVVEQGTGVRLKLQNALSPLLDEGFIEGTLRRQYQPLLDPEFDEILSTHYPSGVTFQVNGRALDRRRRRTPEAARLAICLARKRKPSAVGYLMLAELPWPEEQRGVAISTFGKVIKRGWDWLGITPSAPDRVGGVIEAPALAATLTLNKGDFVRVGARGSLYLGYRKAIQEAVSRQLEAWGDAREPTDEARRRALRPLERDLEQVLVDLAEEFPLLASLVERRAGGQKRLPIGREGSARDGQALVAAAVMQRAEEGQREAGEPEQPEQPVVEGGPHAVAEGESEPIPGGAVLPGTGGKLRPARYGLSIRFEQAPEDPELGRLVESTVVVNEAHPAYRRAAASRSEGYHIALAVALALSRLAVEPAKEHEFVTAFLSHWGEALQRPSIRKRRRQ